MNQLMRVKELNYEKNRSEEDDESMDYQGHRKLKPFLSDAEFKTPKLKWLMIILISILKTRLS